MKKKIFGGIAIVAIAAAAAWNVNYNSQSSKLSDISLANVEALADENTTSSGANSVLITDMGSRSGCNNGYWEECHSYRVDCFGSGSITCTSGSFEACSKQGPCRTV